MNCVRVLKHKLMLYLFTIFVYKAIYKAKDLKIKIMEEWLLTLIVTLSIVSSSLISATIYYTVRCIRVKRTKRSQFSSRSHSSQPESDKHVSEKSDNMD